MIKCAIGQDSHRFTGQERGKSLVLGGVLIPQECGLDGNSDADVVLHALVNAVSGISGENILGEKTDLMCREGITDSRAYVGAALETLGPYELCHVSVSVEAGKPRLSSYIVAMRESIARLCGLDISAVAVTATSGEGLTAFGRGEGIQALVVVSAIHRTLLERLGK